MRAEKLFQWRKIAWDMLGSIRAILQQIISLLIAIITFPLRLLRSLL